eukprot:1060195-Rhodomonas_salina.1
MTSVINHIEAPSEPANLLTANKFELYVRNADPADCFTCFVAQGSDGTMHVSTQDGDNLVHLLTVDDAWSDIADGLTPSNLKSATIAQFKTLLS